MGEGLLRAHRLREGAILPSYATVEAAGADLHACLEQPLTLAPLGRARVPTGLVIGLPHGHEGQVRPRSGLAAKHGVTVLNAPGTIDADYRGELQVLLVNLSSEPYTLQHGDRIAQLVVAPVRSLTVIEAPLESFGETARGRGGFGSTGA